MGPLKKDPCALHVRREAHRVSDSTRSYGVPHTRPVPSYVSLLVDPCHLEYLDRPAVVPTDAEHRHVDEGDSQRIHHVPRTRVLALHVRDAPCLPAFESPPVDLLHSAPLLFLLLRRPRRSFVPLECALNSDQRPLSVYQSRRFRVRANVVSFKLRVPARLRYVFAHRRPDSALHA